MENRYKINFDLKNNTATDIKFKQGDNNSAVLEVTLYDGGAAVSITNEVIEFRFKKADGNVVFQDMAHGVSIVSGAAQCVLMGDVLSYPGVVICEIYRELGGAELIMPAFSFYVAGSIEGAILSGNYISLIEGKIVEWQSDIDGFMANAQADIDGYVLGWQSEIDIMSTAYNAALGISVAAGALEIAAARGTYPTLGDRANNVDAQLDNIVQQTVGLPTNLLVDNLVNPSASLETFLHTCSGKKVIFPANKTYVLERQLILDHLINTEIDFNGCTFKAPTNINGWAARYSATDNCYIGKALIGITSCSNCSFINIIQDGNFVNITPCNVFGLCVVKASDLTFNNTKVSNVCYHAIYLATETKNIVFENTKLYENGGNQYGANADVYISNGNDLSSFRFSGVYIERTTLTVGSQAFYVHGFNGVIEDVTAFNVYSVLDFRTGHHYANNIKAIGVALLISVKSDSDSTQDNLAYVTANNLYGSEIDPSVGDSTGSHITACNKCHITNMELKYKTGAVYATYGIRIKKLNELFKVYDVNIVNLTIKNTLTAAVMFFNLDYTATIKNLNAFVDTANAYLIYADKNSAMQKVELNEYSGFTTDILSTGDKNISLVKKDARPVSTTANRIPNPNVGLTAFDSTLGYIISCKAIGVKEVDTLVVSAAASSSGNVVVTLNGVATNVAVTTSDNTTDLVAAKIRATTFASWITGGTGSTVTFTKKLPGTNSAPSLSGGTTGVTASGFTQSTLGTVNTWVNGAGTTV